MNVYNFESHIEKKILDRGFDYYEYDQVIDIEQFDKTEFSAIVAGTEEYEVYVKMDDDFEIIQSTCTCPYDWGMHCKHLVAVLYYIRDAELHKRKRSKILGLKNLLNHISESQLKEYVLKYIKHNKSFREDFIKHFGL